MFQALYEKSKTEALPLTERLFPPASDRAYWEAFLGEKEIREGEAFLGYEWPLLRASQYMEFQKRGNRRIWETPHFGRRKALLALFLAELAEHQGRFLPDLCDGIFLICEESYWGLSAHSNLPRKGELLPQAEDPYIDLFAAETAELLSVIYHVLYQELFSFCSDIPRRMEYEIDRRITKPYLSHADYHWMGYRQKSVNNWCPWILSNLITAFFTIEMPRTVKSAALTKMLREIDFYYQLQPEDGGCDEGSNYWSKAGARLFAFCDRLFVFSGGKINLFGDEKLRRIGLYEVACHVEGNRFVNFSDGASHILSGMEYILFGFGKRIGEEALCRLAKTVSSAQKRVGIAPSDARGDSICEALYGRRYQKELEQTEELLHDRDFFLPDTQNLFLRRGAWFLGAKGGHNNESHNHNDVGTLVLYHGGTPVLAEAGCGTYTRFTFSPKHRYDIWTMRSEWHNLPTLGGEVQRHGAQYRADRFEAISDGCEISYGNAYPEEAGVSRATRQLTLKEDGLTLRDEFAFLQKEGTVTENFLTPLTPEITENGIKLGEKMLLTCDAAATIEIDRKEIGEDLKLVKDHGTDRLFRIRFCFPAVKSAAIAFQIRKI